MTAHFNHTIIAAQDPAEMAAFYCDLLEATEAPSWGPFINIQLADGVLLQFAAPPMEFPPPRSTTPTCSMTSTSIGPTQRSPSVVWRIGQIRNEAGRERSTPNTAAEASTSSILWATTSN